MYRQPVRAAYSVCPDSHDYTTPARHFLPQSVETRKQHINKQKRAPPPKKGRDALTKLPYCLQVHHKYLVFVTKYRLNSRFGSCIRR